MNLGPLTNNVCLECGASLPRHQPDCSCSPAADFWGKKDPISMARSSRLRIVQNVFDGGVISEWDARDLLSGNLSVGDHSTFYDDSRCLDTEHLKGEER